ncbi:MAG: hypothetical protein GPJ54_17775 [Candidatus Heimdallarchaeota archaeon]|nr:hypothetical protein [Candidatus Heimdallarchaeota archaeon]
MLNNEDAVGIKKVLIDTFDLVEANFLLSFKGIEPENVLVKAQANVNSIYFIIVHCSFHMDGIVKSIDGARIMDTSLVPFLKGEIAEPPLSFKDVINSYLKLSSRFREILDQIPHKKYPGRETPESHEEIYKWLQRIILHYMGHTGQISTLKRIIEDDAQYFMQGVSSDSREKIRSEWDEWWNTDQDRYL